MDLGEGRKGRRERKGRGDVERAREEGEGKGGACA